MSSSISPPVVCVDDDVRDAGDPPELTHKQQDGVHQALESLAAGKGKTLEEVRRSIHDFLRNRL